MFVSARRQRRSSACGVDGKESRLGDDLADDGDWHACERLLAAHSLGLRGGDSQQQFKVFAVGEGVVEGGLRILYVARSRKRVGGVGDRDSIEQKFGPAAARFAQAR